MVEATRELENRSMRDQACYMNAVREVEKLNRIYLNIEKAIVIFIIWMTVLVAGLQIGMYQYGTCYTECTLIDSWIPVVQTEFGTADMWRKK